MKCLKGLLPISCLGVCLTVLLLLTAFCGKKDTIASLCRTPADKRITEIRFRSGAVTTEEMEKERIKWSENPAYRYLLPYDEAVYTEGEVFDTYCALFYEKELSDHSDGMQMNQLLGWPPEDIGLCPQIEYCFAGGGSVLLTFYGAYPYCDDSLAGGRKYDVRLYDLALEGTTYLLFADEKGPFSLAEVNRLGGGAGNHEAYSKIRKAVGFDPAAF